MSLTKSEFKTVLLAVSGLVDDKVVDRASSEQLFQIIITQLLATISRPNR